MSFLSGSSCDGDGLLKLSLLLLLDNNGGAKVAWRKLEAILLTVEEASDDDDGLCRRIVLLLILMIRFLVNAGDDAAGESKTFWLEISCRKVQKVSAPTILQRYKLKEQTF